MNYQYINDNYFAVMLSFVKSSGDINKYAKSLTF